MPRYRRCSQKSQVYKWRPVLAGEAGHDWAEPSSRQTEGRTRHPPDFLVAGEAAHLARDFALVCEVELPSKPVAEYVTKPHLGGQDETAMRMNMLLAAQQVCEEFTDLLHQDRTPNGNNPPARVLEANIQNHLSHFGLMTRGFGSQAICAAASAMQNYIKEALVITEKSYMHPGDQSPADSSKTSEKMEKLRK